MSGLLEELAERRARRLAETHAPLGSLPSQETQGEVRVGARSLLPPDVPRWPLAVCSPRKRHVVVRAVIREDDAARVIASADVSGHALWMEAHRVGDVVPSGAIPLRCGVCGTSGALALVDLLDVLATRGRPLPLRPTPAR